MRLLAVLLFLVFFLGCVSPASNDSIYSPQMPSERPRVCVGEKCVFVELATTQEQRELGLMNRSHLGEDIGMLFIFDELNIYPFWMKNTLIPLDAIWFGEKGVVDIQTMVPCPSDPCPIYTPSGPALYVLEVNAGWAEKNNIQIGDSVHVIIDSGDAAN